LKISGGVLFLTYVLLLSVDRQFIAFNHFSDTGQYPAVLFYLSIAYCLIYAFLFMVSLFAIWAVLKQSKFILRIFALFLLITALLQLSGAILTIVYMKAQIRPLRTYMADNLRSNYTGGYVERWYDKSVDWVQMNYECCGVISPKDYQNGYYYNTHIKYSQILQVPYSCCQFRENLNLLTQCQTNLLHVYRKGCYDILMIWLDRYGSIVASISMVMAFFHLLAFGFAVKNIGKIVVKKTRRVQRQLFGSKYDTRTLDETLSNLETRN